MIKIFISYRREDAADVTGRVNDRLREKFGDVAIFTDVDSIPIGEDFRTHLASAVEQCHVLLAVIGRKWVSIEDSKGQRRLDHPTDFVRTEIELALDRKIPVVPLLAHGITMPTDDQLPDSIKQLAFRNATTIRPDPDFHKDMDRLIAALEKIDSKLGANSGKETKSEPSKPEANSQSGDLRQDKSDVSKSRKSSIGRFVIGTIMVGILGSAVWSFFDMQQNEVLPIDPSNATIAISEKEKQEAEAETERKRKLQEAIAMRQAKEEETKKIQIMAKVKADREAAKAAAAQIAIVAAANTSKLKSIVSQINSNTKSERLSATQNLKSNYADNGEVIGLVLEMLGRNHISKVSAQGRVNALFFLANTEPSAWSKQLRYKGKETVVFLKSVGLGPQASGELNNVSNLLSRL